MNCPSCDGNISMQIVDDRDDGENELELWECPLCSWREYRKLAIKNEDGESQ